MAITHTAHGARSRRISDRKAVDLKVAPIKRINTTALEDELL